MIEVNLRPGGKKRGLRGSRFSLRLPSFGGSAWDLWVLGSSVVVLAVVVSGAGLTLRQSNLRGELEVRLEEERADSAQYAVEILQNEALLARRDSIGQRVQIIQEIDGDRYVWPHIMDEVARALPDFLWLTRIIQVSLGDELQFQIEGRAGNNIAVTQFMENLGASIFIRGVEMLSTEQTIDESTPGAERVVYGFQLEAFFERPPPELLETVPLFNASSAGH